MERDALLFVDLSGDEVWGCDGFLCLSQGGRYERSKKDSPEVAAKSGCHIGLRKGIPGN
jgi:hypothetical protein